MFDKKYTKQYIIAIILVVFASYVGNAFKDKFTDNSEQEYDMIKQYLLSDSPLYGSNKPKLWIHSKYEINARKWLDFQSRNSNKLNQPYLYLSIQSIIDHCSQDFHVCLIDDETFSKLIPGWDVHVSTLADPVKTDLRELGLLKLLHIYGGIVVPDSFVCTRSLIDLYNDCVSNDKPFMIEDINKHTTMNSETRPLFMANTHFMGAVKQHPIIELLITLMSNKTKNGQFTNEYHFTGEEKTVIKNIIQGGKINLIDGKLIGIKNTKNKPILLEDLLEEKFLDISKDYYGIYIPKDDILKRTKYQWFSVITTQELLNSNLAIVKYIKASMVDSSHIYKKSFVHETDI